MKILGAIRQCWGWIAGVLLSLLGLLGLGAWVAQRQRVKASRQQTVELSRELATRAREASQVRLDAAVRRGLEHVEGADTAAQEIVDDDSGTLAQYLVERDSGPSDD